MTLHRAKYRGAGRVQSHYEPHALTPGPAPAGEGSGESAARLTPFPLYAGERAGDRGPILHAPWRTRHSNPGARPDGTRSYLIPVGARCYAPVHGSAPNFGYTTTR